MKDIKQLSNLILVTLILFCFAACTDNEDGRKITGTKEYTLTIASQKVIGVVTSCGCSSIVEMYAAKEDGSDEWQSQSSIAGFDYEEGYEYEIKVKETSYLDERMGEPAWSECELKELISKVKKSSQDVPIHFIPAWFRSDVDVDIKYAIEATDKKLIEDDVKVNTELPWDYHVALIGKSYALWNEKDEFVDCGKISRTPKDYASYPDSYKQLEPEKNVLVKSLGEICFNSYMGNKEYSKRFDSFIGLNNYMLYLYQDLTEYYKAKYPDANVATVVVCYMFNGAALLM